jgi:hypothetical protein
MGSVDTPVQGVYKRILVADRYVGARASGIRKVAGRCSPVHGGSLGGAARFTGEFGFDHFRKETEKL